MYQIKNKVYADSGHILKCNNQFAFQFKDIDINDVLEMKLNLENIKKNGNFVQYDFVPDIIIKHDYDYLKSYFVSKQYSTDDQIAIILNKDDSELDSFRYQKMLEWRVFASELAKKITEL